MPASILLELLIFYKMKRFYRLQLRKPTGLLQRRHPLASHLHPSSSSSDSVSSSRGGARAPSSPPCTARPVRSHRSLSEALGRTARLIAARRRRMAICTSCCQRDTRAYAEEDWPFQVTATSAANFKVRVAAGCGLPSAVHTIGLNTIQARASSTISPW